MAYYEVTEKFLERMKLQLGEEYPSFLESLERPRAVALRFNPLKGTQPALPFVQAQVPWEPMGFYYDPQSRPGLHPYHEAGVYYLQEASAMSAVALLAPQPGERIPGGRRNRCIFFSWDISLLFCVSDLLLCLTLSAGFRRTFKHRADIPPP